MTSTATAPSPTAAASAAETRRWGGELVEGCWLAAVVVVPLALNARAFDSFQPYKATIMRLLAAIMLAAWAIQSLRIRQFVGSDRLPPRRIGIALLVILAWQVVSTVFSINPAASFSVVGDAQGIVRSTVDAVLFLAVALFLRRPAQLERLVTAIIVTSLPISIYALIQRAGLDPIDFGQRDERVFSTLGNGIFLAGYLAMVMPLTAWSLLEQVAAGWPAKAESARRRRIVLLGVMALFQIAGFVGAQSRGPLLGLLGSLLVFGVGWFRLGRQRQWRRPMGAVLAAGLAFILFINLPLSASTRVAQALGLERFSTALALRNGGDPFRKAHWNAGVDLMTSTKPVVFPTGGSDRWHQLRPWIGYGPETLANVLAQRYIWPGTELRVENRLHNRVLDLWYEHGAVGAVAFLAFFLLIFQYGLSQAGLDAGRLTFVLAPALAVLVAALAWAIGGKTFLGLGIIAGLLAGCVATMILGGPPLLENRDHAGTAGGRILLIVALLAALAGHLVETGFAFVVPATSVLFWLYAGMIVALARGEELRPDALAATPPKLKPGKSLRRQRTAAARVESGDSWKEIGAAAFVPTLILVTLASDFIHVYSVDNVSWVTVLERTLTQIRGTGPSHLLWLLFFPTWVISALAFASQEKSSRRWRSILAVSGAVAVGFAIMVGAQIAAIGPVPRVSDPPALAVAQIPGYIGILLSFLLATLALLLGAARSLDPTGPTIAGRWRPWMGDLLALAAGSALASVVAFREIRGESTSSWGKALLNFGRLDAATAVMDQAIRDVPDSTLYYRELGAAFIARAQASQNYEAFDYYARQAEACLRAGAQIAHGMSTTGADLARLYLPWAAFTTDPERRRALAREGEIYFGQQQCFAPHHPVSWLDSAVLDELIHEPDRADRQLEIAASMMDWRTGYWANAYRDLGVNCSSDDLRQAYAAIVFPLYEKALGRTGDPAEIALLRVGRAALNLKLAHVAEARQECLEAQPSLVPREQWQAEAVLAEAERQSQHPAEARMHLDKALATAPAEKQAILREARNSLDGK